MGKKFYCDECGGKYAHEFYCSFAVNNKENEKGVFMNAGIGVHSYPREAQTPNEAE